jgi:predicted pyridoxine 5'-phosphate oxidase superfamily flavin-nucleotide-binding protein
MDQPAPYASDVAFTGVVKTLQARKGSRAAYARMEQAGSWAQSITADLKAEIEAQTSVFLATANAAGQPYIQHRGGPAGFLAVLDEHTIGFADFAGNRQYITQGNLQENAKAQLFLIDYARRRRIKIWGTARVVEGDEALLWQLMPADYRARPEQVVLFSVTAWGPVGRSDRRPPAARPARPGCRRACPASRRGRSPSGSAPSGRGVEHRRGQRADAGQGRIHRMRQAARRAWATSRSKAAAARAGAGSAASAGCTRSAGRKAANSRPDAVPRTLITVPWRMLTCTGAGGSSVRTMVGPWLPHTAMATMWPRLRASSGSRAVARRTGSYCCRLISPSCMASGPSP